MARASTGSNLTPRERVEIALRGGHADRVPFTIYEGKFPQCQAEREMRNRGTCIINRHTPAFKVHTPNVKVTQQYEYRDGKQMTRTIYETPIKTLTSLREPAGFTSWAHEKPFKSPDDFKAILFMIQDEQYEPNHAAVAQAIENFGTDEIVRVGFGLEPLQTLVSGGLMDMQDFCEQWMDNRDEMLKLYHALVEKRRQIYPIVAQSPALIANYGGNVTPEIIGLETFEQYYVQHYNEAAEVMHKHGKLIGCHFDGNCKLLSKAIAQTDLDYIEAFTPAPGTDMTLGEARAAWPNKILWINFPSSVHLKSDAEVTATTLDLLQQVDSPDGLLFSLTEDVPEHRWRHSCPAILDGLEEDARRRPQWYA